MGERLQRKIGPLPLWAWLSLAAVGVYWFYRRSRATASAAATTQTAVAPAAVQAPDANLGGATSAGAPSDNGAATADLLSTYSAGLDSAFSLIGQESQTIAGMAAAAQSSALQIASMQGSATGQSAAPIDTSTAATTGMQPGGSMAPTFQFVFPNLPTVQTSPAAKTPAKSAPKPPPKTKQGPTTTYYTYKRNVPTKPGKTVHFAAGKGYYLA